MLAQRTFLYIVMRLQETKFNNLLIGHESLYFFSLHTRLGTPSYLSQLLDLFAYETPLRSIRPKRGLNKGTQAFVLYYIYHNLSQHSRQIITTLKLKFSKIKSIADLFPNANWLERELSELYGVIFEGKFDTRNLMLQYGDITNPFQKYFPSVGIREIFYNALLDFLAHFPLKLQL